MTTASIGSCGLEALLAILLFRRMAMGVPAGNSAAEAFQIRQIRTATHFMTRLSILRRCWQSVSLFLLSLRRRAVSYLASLHLLAPPLLRRSACDAASS